MKDHRIGGKLLSALLILSLLLPTLASCGGGDDSSFDFSSEESREESGGGSSSEEPLPEDEDRIPDTDAYKDSLPAPIAYGFTVSAKDGTTAGGAKLLSDDKTVFLPRGTTNTLTLTVTAAYSGIYDVSLTYNACGGYVHYLYLHNSSVAGFSDTNAVSRIEATAAVPHTSDDAFAVADTVSSRSLFTLYLKAGENRLSLSIEGASDKSDIGVRDLSFTLVSADYPENVAYYFPTDVSRSETVLTSVGAASTYSDYYSHGLFARDGSVVVLPVTVTETGLYRLDGVISTFGAVFAVSQDGVSADSVSLPTTYRATCSVGATYAEGLSAVYLTAGEHTLSFSLSGGWFHFTALRLMKVADNPDTSKNSLSLDGFSYDTETGFVSFYVKANGSFLRAGSDSYEEIRVRLYARNGAILKEEKKTCDGCSTVRNISWRLETPLPYVRAEACFCNRYGKVLLRSEAIYDAENRLRIAVLSDLHYSGTNDLVDDGILHNSAAKSANSYTPEYDIYGYTSDEKLGEITDMVISEYRRGEIDMVLFLGDSAMNDANYGNYHTDSYTEMTFQKYGTPEDFWGDGCIYNVSRLVKERYFDRLTEAGIPYFCANGNHDYPVELRYDVSGNPYLDYSFWESLYHYKELFGFTETSYVIEAARRDGKLVFYTRLSDERLRAFHEMGYTYYVNDRRASDIPLCAIPMVDGFGVDTFLLYLSRKADDYTYQTYRYEKLDEELFSRMMEATAPYPSVYIAGHLVGKADIVESLMPYRVQAVVYGDLHTEDFEMLGGVPYLCVGQFCSSLDIDSIYTASGAPDSQYYYDRGTPKLSNVVWGDMTRHPWSYVLITSYGSVGTLERVRAPFFYENGNQTRLTMSPVVGTDVRYKLAHDENGKILYRDGSPIYLAENGDYLYRVLLRDENGDPEKSYFYQNSRGAFVPVSLTENQTITDLYIEASLKNQYYVGAFRPEIVIKNGVIKKGERWLHFVYASVFVDENGTERTPAVDKDANSRTVYGVDVPYFTYKRTALFAPLR